MLDKTITIVCGLALALALGACSDDSGPTPDTKQPPKEAGAEAKVDMPSGSETAPPDVGADGVAPDMATGPIDVNAGIAGTQIDRAGRPAISTVLLFGRSETIKDAFNESGPDQLKSGAAADAMNQMIDTLTALGSTPLTINSVPLNAATLKAVLVAGGDVLMVDTSGTTNDYLGVDLGVSGSFGGRALDDDIVDKSLSALTYQAITTDKVDANDVQFKTAFPYLADAH